MLLQDDERFHFASFLPSFSNKNHAQSARFKLENDKFFSMRYKGDNQCVYQMCILFLEAKLFCLRGQENWFCYFNSSEQLVRKNALNKKRRNIFHSSHLMVLKNLLSCSNSKVILFKFKKLFLSSSRSQITVAKNKV